MICEFCGKEIEEKELCFLGIKQTIFKTCECQVKKNAEIKHALEQMEKQARINKNKSICFADTELKKATWKTDDNANAEHSKLLRRYTPQNERVKKGLLLYGECGTGKTYYAAFIANSWLELGKTVFFTSITEYASATFEEKEAITENIKHCDLVIFDDLGTERNSEYMFEQAYNLINMRYVTRKLTIFTTNTNIQEIYYPQNTAEKRIYSRVLEMVEVVEIKGKDRRREKFKKEYKPSF